MTFKAPKPKEPEPRGDVEAGDHLYVHHQGQPCTGVVCAHGRHGVTVKIDGKHHKVKWENVLGHKKRVQQRYDVLDHGEDGMLVRDASGRRRFLALTNESKENPMVAKALGQRPVLLFMKAAGAPPGPGLQQKKITDKNGVQTTRWVSTNQGGPQAQKGQHVGFVNGEHRGHGEVVAAGKDGVTVRDRKGAHHPVPHDKVTHHWQGEGAPDKGPHDEEPPARPNWEPRNEGESDKQYAKRVVDKGASVDRLPEDHGRYFKDTSKTVPLDNLHSTKSEEENQQGGDNGPKRMLAAYHGVLGKRDPITVMPHDSKDGHFEVVDGNGTLTSAKKLGWSSLPVKHVSREEGMRMKAEDAALEAAKAADLAKYSSLPKKAAQPTKDPDELFTKGKEALDQLKKWLDMGKGVASQMGYQTMTKAPEDVTAEEYEKPGGMLFIAPLKSRERSEQKVADDYGGDWSKLLDVVRCTLACDNLHDISDAIKTLEKQGLKPIQVPKDKFTSPTDVGYRDFNFIVEMPNGMAAEIQFNTKDMLRAKNDAHHFYKVTRKIVGKYTSDCLEGKPDQWSEEDRKAYSDAFQEQQRIYNSAWVDHVKKHYGGDSKMVKSLSDKVVLLWRR